MHTPHGGFCHLIQRYSGWFSHQRTIVSACLKQSEHLWKGLMQPPQGRLGSPRVYMRNRHFRTLCLPAITHTTSLVAQTVKNLPAMQETECDPWLGKIPWRKEWLPTPVFLPRELPGQRNLVGYSPWVLRQSDMTEQLTLSIHTTIYKIEQQGPTIQGMLLNIL